MDSGRFFLLALCLSPLAWNVHAQPSLEFLNIDCGKPENFTYTENGLTYTSDFAYIDTGEIRDISPEYRHKKTLESFRDLRSFPDGIRNCYTLKPLKEGERYLVRSYFVYGNYDGLDKLPSFHLYVGVNYLDNIAPSGAWKLKLAEIVTVATSDSLSLCVVNTGQGTPFVSGIEVRPFPAALYVIVNASQALRLVNRGNFGVKSTLHRYPYDIYDRLWLPKLYKKKKGIKATSPVTTTTDGSQPPAKVMGTAMVPEKGLRLAFKWRLPIDPRRPKPSYFMIMHFAELQQLNATQRRIFDIYVNDQVWSRNFIPDYLSAATVHSVRPQHCDRIHVVLNSTAAADMSTLPPLLNAAVLFELLDMSTLETDAGDVAAIERIKELCHLKRWMGDPCEPKDFPWDGVNCSYGVSNRPRVVSLDLSSSCSAGEVPKAIGDLELLQHL